MKRTCPTPKFVIFAMWCALLSGVTTGCDHVTADHPFDPASEVTDQTRGRLRGLLQFPDGFPTAYNTVTPTLVRADSPHGTTETLLGAIDTQGQFVFDTLEPGTYRLTFLAERFFADAITIPVGAGEVVNLGLITLREQPQGSITGFVEVEGRDDFSGVVVSTAGAATQAVSDASGRYRITVPAGLAELSFSLAGYEPPAFAVPLTVGERVLAGRNTDVVRKVRLTAKAGWVIGLVSMRQYQTDERLELARACLVPLPNDSPDCAAADALEMDLCNRQGCPEQPRPDSQAAEPFWLELEPVAVGEYVVVVEHPAYDRITRPVRVRPSEEASLGRIDLPHQSTGSRAVTVSGVVRHNIDDRPLAGIRVDVKIPGAKRSFFVISAVTDIEGVFEFQAAQADEYVLSIDHEQFQRPRDTRIVYLVDSFVIQTDEGTEPLVIKLEEKE